MIRDGEHVPAGHVYVFFGKKKKKKQTPQTYSGSLPMCYNVLYEFFIYLYIIYMLTVYWTHDLHLFIEQFYLFAYLFIT